jgi:hypothetical protein
MSLVEILRSKTPEEGNKVYAGARQWYLYPQ